MKHIDKSKLILSPDVFSKQTIINRLEHGGFNSLAKFELFI